MSIQLYPSIAKIKRNGVYENLPGFVPETGSIATQQMIATSESSATAQYVHEKGEYFRLNDTLYQAIVKINVGDSIVVGTNCEVAVLGNDVTHIANSIAAYELGIATSSHNTGDYFMVGETMYVATADIQVGDNIFTSTNCRLAVVGDELSGLKTAITQLGSSDMQKPVFIQENTYGTFNVNGIVQTDGTLRTDVGTSTDYVEIKQHNKVYWFITQGNNLTGYYHVSFYDENKTIIPLISVPTGSGSPKSGIIDLTQPGYEKAKYVRVSVNSRGTQYLLDNCCLCLSAENNVNENHLAESLKKSLFSNEYTENGVYYLTTQGEIDSSGYLRSTNTTTKRVSDLIPLNNYAKIVVNTTGSGNTLFFYDRAKRILNDLSIATSNSGYYEFVPTSDYANAAYCRFQGYDSTSTFSPDFYRLKIVRVNPYGTNKFNGKQVLIFGDSITAGSTLTVNASNETTAYSSQLPATTTGRKIWSNILKDEYAFSEVRNYALSGATWAKKNNNALANAYSQVTVALNDLDNPNNVFPNNSFTPDIVIFALGINDTPPNDSYDSAMNKTIFYEDNPTIDYDSTIANLDVEKTFESMRWSLLTIKNAFPQAMVFVSLPLQCAKNSALYGSNLVNDIRKMGERCGCVIIDSTNESGIIPEGNFYNYTGTGTTLADGLHPNKIGQLLLARTIINALIANYKPLNF